MDFILQLRKAMNTGNDCKFFKLYQNAPHMSGYLIDYMLNPMRNKLYEATIKSYDTISLPFMMKKLHFMTPQECKEFLDSRHVRYVGDESSRVTASSSSSSSSNSSNGGGDAIAVANASSLKSTRKDKKKEKKEKKQQKKQQQQQKTKQQQVVDVVIPVAAASASVPPETLHINCRDSRTVQHV